MQVQSTRQDQLIVYYKTSSAGTWTQLASYTTSVASWTQRTISLPSGSSDYYIAFEGNAKNARGVCVDDVQVTCTTVPVSVSIAATGGTTVCDGTTVNFTATPTNGGTSPAYQWKVNGASITGSTNATYSYVPANNDAVTCVLTSNNSCVTGNPATSNTLTMTVNPVLTLANSITTPLTTLCEGTSVAITCNHNYPVSSCDWYVNGEIVSHGMDLTYSPVNGDQAYCVCWVTPGGCWLAPSATSNTLVFTVNPVLPVSVSIFASANPVYEGTPVTFTAVPVNGGSSPSYGWFVNGSNVGPNSDSYIFVPVNGDQVSCTLTSSESCTSSNPANSNTITKMVNSVPSVVELQDITVSGSQCFNAAHTIMVAGNETSFTVPTGATALMIAGENIFYLPGTVVDMGGSMIGYIDPDGPWCPQPSIVTVIAGKQEVTGQPVPSFCKIYPNPTKGQFSLESTGIDGSENLLVEIYGIRGEKIFSSGLSGKRKYEFSLGGRPAGIYLVHILNGKNYSTTRLILQD
jgi:hypothetical protein